MKSFWENVEIKIQSGVKTALLVVVKSSGSSPGKAGFKMMISEDGDVAGSIGGGTMEYNIVRKVREELAAGTFEIMLKKQEHKSASPEDKSGLICSGVQWIAFYPVDKKDLQMLNKIINIEQDEKSDIVTYTQNGIDVVNKTHTHFVDEKRWLFTETPGLKNTLYIFGGGHVSLALSRIMKTLDFKVKVYDNRKDVTTFDKNVYADEKTVINYNAVKQLVPEGNHVFVAIMTFAHKQDYQVLKQLTDKKVKYIGMMGSRQKVESVFELLKNDGVPQERLKKIDAPIGMEIGSDTPAEIAVSVAAKIISVKNKI